MEGDEREVQLLTIVMDDGSQATFIGTPLVEDFEGASVAEAWFSSVKLVSDQTTLKELMEFTRTNKDITEYSH